MNKQRTLSAALVASIMIGLPHAGDAQVMTWTEKAKNPSRNGQIYVLIEPNTPFRLIFQDGTPCLQISHTLAEPMWVETTHKKFNSWKAKPPAGWSVGACTADKEGGK